MAEVGRLSVPEQMPDWAQEWPGQGIVRIPLRATPYPHIRLVAGTSNQAFVVRAIAVPEWPALVAKPRLFRGARPTGQTVSLDVAVASTGVVAAALLKTAIFASSIASLASVVASFVRSRPLASTVLSSSTVDPDLSGGVAGLVLTPEAEDTPATTLTPESSTGLTLTPEVPDTLDLD